MLINRGDVKGGFKASRGIPSRRVRPGSHVRTLAKPPRGVRNEELGDPAFLPRRRTRVRARLRFE